NLSGVHAGVDGIRHARDDGSLPHTRYAPRGRRYRASDHAPWASLALIPGFRIRDYGLGLAAVKTALTRRTNIVRTHAAPYSRVRNAWQPTIVLRYVKAA